MTLPKPRSTPSDQSPAGCVLPSSDSGAAAVAGRAPVAASASAATTAIHETGRQRREPDRLLVFIVLGAERTRTHPGEEMTGPVRGVFLRAGAPRARSTSTRAAGR